MPTAAIQPERRVLLLGSTGSIGTQTLDVIDHLNALAAGDPTHPRYRVVGLAAHRSTDLLAQQAKRFNVPVLAVSCNDTVISGCAARVLRGPESPEQLVREVDADIVVAAMVGSAGLPATLAAVRLGRDIALANKETLVAAGSLIVPAARASGSRLLPVDSEHSALWQCLQGIAGSPHACPPMAHPASVAKLILTASGGALRHLPSAEMYHATPAMALKHPTWSMGAKVTIDSASLTNKAFEVIEAHWLFGTPAEQIHVVVHPQSIVHSLVEYTDGNILAQLGSPDMKGPIQYALTFPQRPVASARRMDLTTLSKLEFSIPDLQRYPALGIAYAVIRDGGTSGAVFNAASEVAVEAFLAAGGAMPFGQLGELVHEAMSRLPVRPVRELGDVLAADREARDLVWARLASSVHAAMRGTVAR